MTPAAKRAKGSVEVGFTISESDHGWEWEVRWRDRRWVGCVESQELAIERVRAKIDSLGCSAAFADDERTEAECANAMMRLKAWLREAKRQAARG